ncbi:MAG: hypothetical protein RL497_2875 [Pseudomonadota bacterium]
MKTFGSVQTFDPVQTYDLIIIGAGIHGAGFSYIASAMGLKCLLIEKSPQVGSATSSNSSKLIHGGLRYLESGQIRLVRECLKERTRLLKSAPDIVTLKPFYIPIYKNSRRANCTIALGLSVYQLLGGKNFKYLGKQEWPNFPIKQQQLTGLWQYWDCQTDDLLLTRRVIKAAQNFGCHLELNTQPSTITLHNNHYQLNLTNSATHQNNIQVQSRCLINAAGPWVNEVAALHPHLPQTPIQWVQGSHLVLNQPALDGCFYLESPLDGRPFFVLPWHGQRLIGTTETILQNPNETKITTAEIHYLLTSYNHYFAGHTQATEHNISRTFCGSRVLPHSASSHNTNSSHTPTAINRAHRETHLHHTPQMPGYLALYGGKLTSFYATAHAGMTLLMPHLNVPKSVFNHPNIQQPTF